MVVVEAGAQMIRVLLADDHEIFLDALSHLLERDPRLEVIGAETSARAALALAEEVAPDVIVLDVVMPGTNGIQAAGELRARMPGTAVVLISGIDHDDLARRAAEVGAHAWLTKADAVQRLPDVVVEAAAAEAARYRTRVATSRPQPS